MSDDRDNQGKSVCEQTEPVPMQPGVPQLVLIHKRLPHDADRYAWTPFQPDERFNSDWWTQSHSYGDGYSYVQVFVDSEEVARVELDEDVELSHYTGAPSLGASALEIQFIEVAADQRGRGIATEFVRQLMAAHPSRRLVAFSEEADEFWSSLGWDRFDHPDGPTFYRPLFVQPARA
jgi:GNAT superfamily N-acetyltransferase